MEQIKISVKGAKLVDFKLLKGLQGKLKDLPEDRFKKLKQNIIDEGITEPITIWENKKKMYVVNGHQRLKTIQRMVYDEGFKCPKIPVSVMEGKNLKEVKRRLLSLASQYGVFTDDGLTEFLQGMEIKPYELLEKFEFEGFDTSKFVNALKANEPEEKEDDVEEKKVEKKTADTKTFTLTFDAISASEFTLMLEQLTFKYNTKNITDTVFTAVKQAFEKQAVLRKKEHHV